MSGVLDGVCVLDFGRYIAGPFAAALLGDLGADVIRVERIGGGEDRALYSVTKSGDGALYLQMNRNKRSLAIDTKTPGGALVLERLVQKSGIVMANLPGAGLRDLGIDYASLTRIRPDAILAAVSAFGAHGPYATKVGFDGVAQAMSGAPYLSGFGPPTKSFASWCDMTTAMLAAFATLAAIHERTRSGRGQVVSANLLASALTVMNYPLIEQHLVQADRRASGNRGQTGAPADIFETADGWIAVQVIGDNLFRRWARLVGAEDLLSDPRCANDTLRAEHAGLISERMIPWCKQVKTERALELLAEARLPAGPVLSPAQALVHPEIQGGGYFDSMDYPGASAPAPIARPIEMSATPPALSRRAPALGEHTEEILDELGFSAREVEALRRGRVI